MTMFQCSCACYIYVGLTFVFQSLTNDTKTNMSWNWCNDVIRSSRGRFLKRWNALQVYPLSQETMIRSRYCWPLLTASHCRHPRHNKRQVDVDGLHLPIDNDNDSYAKATYSWQKTQTSSSDRIPQWIAIIDRRCGKCGKSKLGQQITQTVECGFIEVDDILWQPNFKNCVRSGVRHQLQGLTVHDRWVSAPYATHSTPVKNWVKLRTWPKVIDIICQLSAERAEKTLLRAKQQCPPVPKKMPVFCSQKDACLVVGFAVAFSIVDDVLGCLRLLAQAAFVSASHLAIYTR